MQTGSFRTSQKFKNTKALLCCFGQIPSVFDMMMHTKLSHSSPENAKLAKFCSTSREIICYGASAGWCLQSTSRPHPQCSIVLEVCRERESDFGLWSNELFYFYIVCGRKVSSSFSNKLAMVLYFTVSTLFFKKGNDTYVVVMGGLIQTTSTVRCLKVPGGNKCVLLHSDR